MFCVPTWKSVGCSVSAVLRRCADTATDTCTDTHANCATDTAADGNADTSANATNWRPLTRPDDFADAFPDTITSNTMVRAYAQVGKLRDAFALLEES